MQTLQTFLFVIQIIVSVALIGIVLIQHGKGADTGAAFGSGASSTVFGSRGSGNFLTRTTTVLAIIFLANSMMLGYLASEMVGAKGSLLDQVEPGSITQPLGGQAPAVPTGDTTAAVPVDTSTAQPEQPAPATPSTDVPALPESTGTPSDVPAVPPQ